MGWWTDKDTGESLVGKRPLGMITALIHSEVSEAMEGLRKNLQDDHLPERPMVEVELADTAIRCYDFLGSELSGHRVVVNEDIVSATKEYVQVTFETLDAETEIDYLAGIHTIISDGYKDSVFASENKPTQNAEFAHSCLTTIVACEEMSDKFGYDLTGAMTDKLAYNLTRADHKLENRKKEGGKEF